MSEKDIFSYFLEIEDYFCSQRNAPLLLSPIDYEKVTEWFNAHIPIEVVKRGIARYFEKLKKRKTPLRKAICLSFAETEIIKALEEYRKSRVGEDIGEIDYKERKNEYLNYLEEKINNFLAKEEAVNFKEVLSILKLVLNLIKAFKEDEKLTLSDIETKLSPIEKELTKALFNEIEKEKIKLWEEEIKHDILKKKSEMEKEILKAIIEKTLTNKIYSYCGLPRLSILYFNG